MNNLKYKKSQTFLATGMLLIIVSLTTFAQKPVSRNAIDNLITGINSENEGLRRSAIYFAGKYEYAETTEALVAQLKKEDNPNTRLLIANALFRIGDPFGMEAVLEISQSDSNAKVKRIAGAIYETFVLVNSSAQETQLAQD